MEQTTTVKNAAELPFLDHLEELRWRIVWSLEAVVVGVVVSFLRLLGFGRDLDLALVLRKRERTRFVYEASAAA